MDTPSGDGINTYVVSKAIRAQGIKVALSGVGGDELFATTANLQKILYALETQQPYLVVENLRVSPLNAFRGFKPAPGSEPEVNVLFDVVGFAYAEADKK